MNPKSYVLIKSPRTKTNFQPLFLYSRAFSNGAQWLTFFHSVRFSSLALQRPFSYTASLFCLNVVFEETLNCISALLKKAQADICLIRRRKTVNLLYALSFIIIAVLWARAIFPPKLNSRLYDADYQPLKSFYRIHYKTMSMLSMLYKCHY